MNIEGGDWGQFKFAINLYFNAVNISDSQAKTLQTRAREECYTKGIPIHPAYSIIADQNT